MMFFTPLLFSLCWSPMSLVTNRLFSFPSSFMDSLRFTRQSSEVLNLGLATSICRFSKLIFPWNSSQTTKIILFSTRLQALMSVERASVPRVIPERMVIPLISSFTNRRLFPSTMTRETLEGISFSKSSSSLPSLCFLWCSRWVTFSAAWAGLNWFLSRIFASFLYSISGNWVWRAVRSSEKFPGLGTSTFPPLPLLQCLLDLDLSPSFSDFEDQYFPLVQIFLSIFLSFEQLLSAIFLILSSGTLGYSFWYSPTRAAISTSIFSSTFSPLLQCPLCLPLFSCLSPRLVLIWVRSPFETSISLMISLSLRSAKSSQSCWMSSCLRLYLLVTSRAWAVLDFSFSSTLLISPLNLLRHLVILSSGTVGN